MAATEAEKMTVTRMEPRYKGSVRIVRKFSSQTNSVCRPKGPGSARLVDCLGRRPKEKDDRNGELGRNEEIRKDPVRKDDTAGA